MKTAFHRHIAWLALVMSAMVASSCSEQYNILGSSSVDNYEGGTFYLKVSSDGALCSYDSSEVSHGKFGFEGVVDTVCMAQLFIGDHSLLPIVLENGEISVKFTDAESVVKGGMLNDRLYKFLRENSRLQNEIQNASRNMARLILREATPASYDDLERKSMHLQDRLDRLWTAFIINNADNVLGATYFQEYTSQYFYPVITPQIDKILKRAPKSFLDNPEVRMYIRDAEYNMQLMQGKFP
jgi:hypothetical protein